MMDIEKLAREAGLAAYPDEIQRFADLVRRETAEEAAKVCEECVAGYHPRDVLNPDVPWEANTIGEIDMANECAAAIRERFKAS